MQFIPMAMAPFCVRQRALVSDGNRVVCRDGVVVASVISDGDVLVASDIATSGVAISTITFAGDVVAGCIAGGDVVVDR